MRYITLLALLTGVMLYLVMGALVFSTLELPKESSAYEDLLKAKQNFLDNNSCVTELDFHNLVKVKSHYIIPLKHLNTGYNFEILHNFLLGVT